jgi:hypothetical protein
MRSVPRYLFLVIVLTLLGVDDPGHCPGGSMARRGRHKRRPQTYNQMLAMIRCPARSSSTCIR